MSRIVISMYANPSCIMQHRAQVKNFPQKGIHFMEP